MGESADELKNSPPFGRPQRQISKTKNFSENSNNINDKVELISAAVLQGNTESKQEMAALMVKIMEVLTNVDGLRVLTQGNFAALATAITRLRLPENYRAAGFAHRLYSLSQYKAEQGLVNLFLLSNIAPPRTINKPLLGRNVNGNLTAISITGIVNSLQEKPPIPEKFIDLEMRTIITRVEAIILADSGVDGGLLNGQPPPLGGFVA